MKVLVLNTSERTGGAAVAANRLMHALKNIGVEVKMLVRDKQTDDPDVITVNQSFIKRKINFIRFVWERLIIFFSNHFSKKELFRVSIASTGIDVSNLQELKNIDIIHIHWINQGFISLDDIKKLTTLNVPIVWTMHDMWPCTGICHHARECEHYYEECGKCFYLKSNKQDDLSFTVFAKKKELYRKANITFVCCSKWLAGCATKSEALVGKKIVSIPNPIDTFVFHLSDKMDARSELNLPRDKKLLLFGALNITDERKGVSYLLDAIKLLDYTNLELVVFGQVKEDISHILPVRIHPQGYMIDENKISLLYNAVDLFVTSSLEENLPNTIMESMACGTPCVGFNTGGIPEMIDHKINGYLAKYKDVSDLAAGIQWVLEYENQQVLSDACVKKVQANYTEKVVAEKYISLYSSLLNGDSK